MKSPNRLDTNIVEKLGDIRKTLRRYVLIQAACLCALWLFAVFWIGGLIDYLPVRAGSNESPTWVRIALLSAMGVGCLYVLLRKMLPRLLARLQDSSLALLIERKYPTLNNELVTAIQLQDNGQDNRDLEVSNPEAYAEMIANVNAASSQHVGQVQPSELFHWQPLWALAAATALACLLTITAIVAFPTWMQKWSSRLLLLSDAPWPRRAALRADGIELQVPPFTGQLSSARVTVPFEDSVARVPTGAAALLQISADTSAREIPDVCTLFYYSDSGARGRANLRRVGTAREGWQAFTIDGPPLDGMTESLSVDVVGLDARLRDLLIEVVDAPTITKVEMACIYPRYLVDADDNRPQTETLDYRNGQLIPEGTQITLSGIASSELSKVEYVVFSPSAGGSSDAVVRIARIEKERFTIELDAIQESSVVEIRLIDKYQLPSDQVPRYVISMLPDTIPEVASRLEGIGSAITAKALIPIRGTVIDDHAIASINADLALDDNERTKVKLNVDVDGNLETDVDLLQLADEGKFHPEPGMTLGFVVAATDHYNLDSEDRIGMGQSLQLSVVNESEMLVILDRQELEQRQRLELIIQELTQTRDQLQSIQTELQSLVSPTAIHRTQTPAQLVGMVARQNDPAQTTQRAAIKAQQCQLQGDKSQQELSSLAAHINSLRLQLINNRIDSYDRQERLQSKVYLPLRALLEKKYAELQAKLAGLMTATASGSGLEEVRVTLEGLDLVLVELEKIKENMQDMESFNEIVDMVRGLLDEQDSLLDSTEKKQKQRILDLLR